MKTRQNRLGPRYWLLVAVGAFFAALGGAASNHLPQATPLMLLAIGISITVLIVNIWLQDRQEMHD